MRTLHIAAAQIHSGGTVDENLDRAERQIKAAATVGADVILIPEGALQGYDYDVDRAMLERVTEPEDGPGCNRVVDMAAGYGLSVIIGFLERDGDAFYNSALVARPDGTRSVQRKHGLNKIELDAGFVPGPRDRTIFEFNGVKTAIVICADSGIKDLAGHLKEIGAEYRFCPTGGGGKMADMLHDSDLATPDGRKKYEENRPKVFKTDAVLDECADYGIGFTAANALGPVGRRTCHQGHCMIVDNNFVMRAQMPGTIVLDHQQDQMIHAELRFL